jgi:transglutaminase/protease-like cytokinesis protein 3
MKKSVLLGFILLVSFTVKSQHLQDSKEQARLLKHVELTPEAVAGDPQLLVKYLKKAAKNEKQAIELIYYWIANNINYDVVGFVTKNTSGVTDGRDILKSRKALCMGYATLFQLLCSNAGVECVLIGGYAKGYGYAGHKADKPNHNWNAVKLNGKWKLVDPTWGSGCVLRDTTRGRDTLGYIKILNTGYLFSKPEGFIIEHFPTDPTWQLLAKPVTLNEFYSKEMDEKRNNIDKYLK